MKILYFLVVLFTTTYLIPHTSSFEVAGNRVSWASCVKIVSGECGRQVHSYVFDSKERVVSLQCCVELVEMGKKCHDAFLEANLKDPIYQCNSTEIRKRSSNIWNRCFSVVKGKTPPERCERMPDPGCENQIVGKIFHNVGAINDTCCGYLIHREKECHDSLDRARIARGGYESNKTQVLEGSLKVWNKCAYIAQNLPNVKSCKSNFTDTCGIQVGQKVLLNKGKITKDCCIQVLKNGRDCHDLLALTDVALPQFQAYSLDILDRSAIAWNKCVAQVR